MSYYHRPGATHLDGTPIFATAEDKAAESYAAEAIEAAWGCEVRSFGQLAPIDFFAVRDGRLVGVLEVKHRTHRLNDYPTAMLNVRKWLALLLASEGLRVPALYVHVWPDAAGWINVADVDPTKVRVGGCSQRVKSVSDVEPVILVPTSAFTPLAPPQEQP